MNSALQVLLKALANIEQNENNIQNQINACKKELVGWEKDLSDALKAKEEIQLAIKNLQTLDEIIATPLSKLGETNEDTSSKETASRSTTTKKRK